MNNIYQNLIIAFICIVAFVCAIIITVVVSKVMSQGNSDHFQEFREACTQVGGKTVFDGRQMVCMK